MVATVASLPPNILTSNLVPTEPSAHSSLNDPHMSNSPHPFPPVLDRKPVLSSGGSISGPINLLADVALDSSISATSFQKPSITLPLSSPSGAHPGGPHPHDQERLPNVRAGDRRGSLVLEHPGYERSLAGGHSRPRGPPASMDVDWQKQIPRFPQQAVYSPLPFTDNRPWQHEDGNQGHGSNNYQIHHEQFNRPHFSPMTNSYPDYPLHSPVMAMNHGGGYTPPQPGGHDATRIGSQIGGSGNGRTVQPPPRPTARGTQSSSAINLTRPSAWPDRNHPDNAERYSQHMSLHGRREEFNQSPQGGPSNQRPGWAHTGQHGQTEPARGPLPPPLRSPHDTDDQHGRDSSRRDQGPLSATTVSTSGNRFSRLSQNQPQTQREISSQSRMSDINCAPNPSSPPPDIEDMDDDGDSDDDESMSSEEDDDDNENEDELDDEYVPGSLSRTSPRRARRNEPILSPGPSSTRPRRDSVEGTRASGRLQSKRQPERDDSPEGDELFEIAEGELPQLPSHLDGVKGSMSPPKKRTYIRRDAQRRKQQNAQAQKKFRMKKKAAAEQMRIELDEQRAVIDDLRAKHTSLNNLLQEKNTLLIRLRNDNGRLKHDLDTCRCGAYERSKERDRKFNDYDVPME